MQTRCFRANRLSAVFVTMAASAACFAGGGEALDIELPSMRTPVPVAAAAPQMTQAETALAAVSPYAAASFGAAPTRAQVRAQLKEARLAGTLSRQGDAGDTREVLAARERFNAQQSEAIVAEYVADQERTVALAAAEQRRAEIEAEGLIALQLAEQNASTLDDSTAAAVADETEVRSGVLSGDVTSTTEGPDAAVAAESEDAAHRERVLAVRREVAEDAAEPVEAAVEPSNDDVSAPN